MSERLRRPASRGATLVEALIALPIVLLLGLGALQWILLFHARTALEYALVEAARAGSVAQARPGAIEDGLARGLMPFWYGVGASRPWAAAIGASGVRLRQGLAAGWIVWRQISPTLESFGDWGEPALDAAGRPMPGVLEIPNDGLQWSALRQPAGGVAGLRDAEPIGARSHQTLNDANLLKLELRYGMPMTVPLVGRIAVWVMRIVDGCAAPSGRWVGALDLGTPAPAAAPKGWACAMYLAPNAAGAAVPRWPVRTTATVRMQSPARQSAMTPAGSGSPAHASPPVVPVGMPSAGQDSVPSPVLPGASGPFPAPAVEGGVGGVGDAGGAGGAGGGFLAMPAPNGGSGAGPASGWLRLGGDRSFSVPGACS